MSRLSSATRKLLARTRGLGPKPNARRGPLEQQIGGDPDDPRTKLANARLTKELELAEKYRLLNACRKGELLQTRLVREGFGRAAAVLRLTFEALIRNYSLGDDAMDLIDDGFKGAAEEMERVIEESVKRAGS